MALGLTGVVVVALVGFTGYQALQARDALQTVAADFEEIADALTSGEQEAARARLQSAQDAAAEASANTQGPGWWITSRLPGVGDDVDAVRTVADVTDRLAVDVLPTVIDAGEKLTPESLRPTDGRIDTAPLAEVAPAVIRADAHMQLQEDRVAAIDTAELNDALAEPVELMQTKLADAASLSAKASYAVRLLPSMLGADGERTYLVLFQNNAEVRATGGIPGAWATMTVHRGRIRLGQQGGASEFGELPRPALPVTDEELDLFSEELALFPQNINFTPDFPRTAQLARAMWQKRLGTAVDGIVSVDPVALSYVLEGTGPVDLPGGERLAAEDAVPLLLNDIYSRLPDPAAQDAFFAAAARAVFEKIVSGAGDPTEVLDGLTRGVRERRVYAWSSVEAEQDLLAQTPLGGEIPLSPGVERPFVGVFLNDGTGAKMQYFLEHRVDVEPVACNREGRQELEVTVTLRSTAPRDPSQLPDYVVGMAEQIGVEPGSMRLVTHLYAPVEGWVESSTIDGEELPVSSVDHLGHPVVTRTVDLAPGQTRRLRYVVMSGLDQPGAVNLRVTPGAHSSGVGDVQTSACSAS
ncbi:DUF4012 domain-containing protein [Nocardioides pakistanensis]